MEEACPIKLKSSSDMEEIIMDVMAEHPNVKNILHIGSNDVVKHEARLY